MNQAENYIVISKIAIKVIFESIDKKILCEHPAFNNTQTNINYYYI